MWFYALSLIVLTVFIFLNKLYLEFEWDIYFGLADNTCIDLILFIHLEDYYHYLDCLPNKIALSGLAQYYKTGLPLSLIAAEDSFLTKFFKINLFLVNLSFVKINSLTFWLIPPLILFFGGLSVFLKSRIFGRNEAVWSLVNKILFLSFTYNTVLLIMYMTFNANGIFLKVGYLSLISLPVNIGLLKLILINTILLILYLTNGFIQFYYYINLEQVKGELGSLILFLGFGATMVFFQNDLFSIFLYLEIISFCIYGFLFLQKWTNEQLQDLIRYVLFSLWITTLFVLSISFYLSWSDSSTNLANSESLKILFKEFSFHNLKTLVFSEPQLTFSLLLLIFYFLFKLGLGPFFTWTIPVYNSCSTLVLPAISLIPKLVYFFSLFFFLFLNFFSFLHIWSDFLLIIGVLTVFIGSSGIVKTTKLKEIYSWSSIIHTGNISCIMSIISKETMSFMYFYILSYVFVSIGFIFVFTSLKNKSTGRFIKTTNELFSVNKLMSFFSLSSITTFSSSAGFTPLISFFMKLSMFFCVSQIHSPFIALLLGLLNIGGAIIYLKILRSLIGFNFNFFNYRFFLSKLPSIIFESNIKLSYFTNFISFFLIFGLIIFIDFFFLLNINGTLVYNRVELVNLVKELCKVQVTTPTKITLIKILIQ